MREDTCTCEIKEVFTPEEFAEIGNKLCGKLADLETVASEKKAADATFNERKKVLESEIETLYRQYNKGYEMAQIGCDIRYNDPTPGQKSIYHMDTAQHVETLEMTWEEKQEELQWNLSTTPDPTADAVNDALGQITDSAELPPPPIQPEQKPPEAEA